MPHYTISDDVLSAHLENEAVLLHMGTKDYYRLNPTASMLWRGMERGEGPAAVTSELVAHFDVDPATAGAAVAEALAEMAARGLVVEVDARAAR